MKKFAGVLAAMTLALALTACAKSQSATYTMESTDDTTGLTMTDTMVLEAKGDKVQNVNETINVDASSYDEDTQTVLATAFDEMVAAYQAVDGVTASGEMTDGVYVITIAIDATGDAVSELADQGLLELNGEGEGLSFAASCEALENNGYTLSE